MSFSINSDGSTSFLTTELWVNLRVVEVSGPPDVDLRARVQQLVNEGRIFLPIYNYSGEKLAYYFVSPEDESHYRWIENLKEEWISNSNLPRDLALLQFEERILAEGSHFPKRVISKAVQDLYEASFIRGYEPSLVSIKRKANGKFRVVPTSEVETNQQLLGKGGFGEVYRKRGITLNPLTFEEKVKPHAQKVLNPERDSLREELMGVRVLDFLTFQNEGKTPKGVQEAPHLHGKTLITKEYRDGDFKKWHLANRSVPTQEIATLLLGPIEGLAFASSHGAQFFDIKSSNLLKNGPKVVLSDFGGAFILPTFDPETPFDIILGDLGELFRLIPDPKYFPHYSPKYMLKKDREEYIQSLERLRQMFIEAEKHAHENPVEAEALWKSLLTTQVEEVRKLGEGLEVFLMTVILLKQLVLKGSEGSDRFFTYEKGEKALIKSVKLKAIGKALLEGSSGKRLKGAFTEEGVTNLQNLLYYNLGNSCSSRMTPHGLLMSYQQLLSFLKEPESA